MKKKTVLSLLTGVAIVAATTGSYAAWDSLEATSEAKKVTLRKPVTVTATLTEDASETSGLGEALVYEMPISVKAEDIPADKLNSVHWEFETSITQGSENTPVSSDDVKVEVVDSITGSPAASPAPTQDGDSFKVKITPQETDPAKALAQANTELSVSVTAKLVNNVK